MFGSDEWHDCKHSKCVKSKNAFDTIMSHGFWSTVMDVLKIFSPLVKFLRLAEGENIHSLGFIYGEIVEAKKPIKEASNHLEKNFQTIFWIIDEKIKDRLDCSLHVDAYFFKPYYFYKDPEMLSDFKIMDRFIACAETFYHGDFEKQDIVVNHQINFYKNKRVSFGRPLALKGCAIKDDNFDPCLYVHITCFSLSFDLYSSYMTELIVGNWWSTYGCDTPTLQKMATRILALTSSSSGYERNWSYFEGVSLLVFFFNNVILVLKFIILLLQIHTRKRNRLDVNRLNSLLYVQFNAKLFKKQKKLESKMLM